MVQDCRTTAVDRSRINSRRTRLSPFLNYHRSCHFPVEIVGDDGRATKKLKSLDDAERFLKPDVSFAELDVFAGSVSASTPPRPSTPPAPSCSAPSRRTRPRDRARSLRRRRWVPVPSGDRVFHRLPTAALLSEGIAPVDSPWKTLPGPCCGCVPQPSTGSGLSRAALPRPPPAHGPRSAGPRAVQGPARPRLQDSARAGVGRDYGGRGLTSDDGRRSPRTPARRRPAPPAVGPPPVAPTSGGTSSAEGSAMRTVRATHRGRSQGVELREAPLSNEKVRVKWSDP